MPKVVFNQKYFMQWLESYTEVDELKKEAKAAFKGINQKNMFKKAHKITGFLDHVVTIIERCASDFSTIEGKDEPSGKKKLDIAVKFLDECIQLPFYLEWFDDNIIRFLLSKTVSALNTHMGDDWKLNNDV